jgi:uncharacterized membrane protein YccC
MNDFFAMVVELAKHFKDHPEVFIGIIITVGVIALIWVGKLKGTITFGG